MRRLADSTYPHLRSRRRCGRVPLVRSDPGFAVRTFAPRRRGFLGATPTLPALPGSLPTSVPTLPNGIPNVSQAFGQLPPQAQQGWQLLDQQLQAEGTNPSSLAYYTAQNSYASAINSLSSSIPSGQISPATVIGAAQSYVAAGYTVLGSVGQIQGLINAANAGQATASVVQAFTGVLIGTAVAAGSVTAGVGAAIVAGVAIVSSLVASLFGQNKPSANVSGCKISPPPSYTVGSAYCMGDSSPAVPPAAAGAVPAGPVSAYWRRFPNLANAADQAWFKPFSQIGSWTSGSSTDTWGVCYTNFNQGISINSQQSRPIDEAFPQYRMLECEQQIGNLISAVMIPAGSSSVSASIQPGPGQLSNALPQPTTITVTPEMQAFVQFQKAFFAAWKANQEYAINGLAPRADWQVLVQVVYLWNNAHDPGNGFTITPPSSSSSPNDVTTPAFCSPTTPTYESLLVPTVGQQDSSAAGFNVATNSITINTGPVKASVVAASAQGGANLAASTSRGGGSASTAAGAASPSSSSSGSSALFVVGGAAAILVGGTYLYGRSHGMTFKQTAEAAWTRVKRPFTRRKRKKSG